MADRLLIDPTDSPRDRERRTIIVGDRRGAGLDDTPAGDGGSVRFSQRLQRVQTAARREFTVAPEGACLPVILGGPLKVGGFPIYIRETGGGLYIHFAVCEGPLKAIGAITNIRFSGIPAASVNCTTEIHLGVAGDTTSALINAIEPTYAFPEGTAGVVCHFTWPGPGIARFSPLEFTAEVIGWKAPDFSGGADADTTNIVRQAAQCLINRGFVKANDFVTAEWLAGQQACDYDIDPGAGTTKRWEISRRIDTVDTLENHVNKILEHCHGHLRHDGEKYGLWLDLPRSVAQVGGTDLSFSDEGTVPTLAGKPTIVWRGRSEIPTCVVADYTDKANGYITSSVSVPDPPPAGEYIEVRIDRSGHMTREMARRSATLEYNLRQLERDITFETWLDGFLPQEGDRVKLRSQRVIPSAETPPNVAGAAAGEEHVVIEEQTVTPTSVLMRCSLYRDNTFSDVIDTSGGPNPPGTTPNVPDPPTDLVLTEVITWTNGVPNALIKIEWTPADEPSTSYTRITYSFDGVNFLEFGSGFSSGPVFLDNARLGVGTDFALYTVRTSTGQVSSALTGSITPVAIDPNVPMPKQGLITASGYFQCFPPIGNLFGMATSGPSSAPTVGTLAGGIVPIGDYNVTYSWVFPQGETNQSPRTLVHVTAGNQRIDISDIADGPAAVVYKKVYISNVDTVDPTDQMYITAELAVGATSMIENSNLSWVLSNNEAPQIYDYAAEILIYDLFGATSWPPVAMKFSVSSPPHKYNMIDVRKLIHPDPTTGQPRIDLLVAISNTVGAISGGAVFHNTSVYWPTNNPIGTGPEQTMMAMPAYDGQTLTLVNGSNNDVALGGKHRQLIAGPSGAFTITGFAGGTAGQRITVINGVAQQMTIAHNSGSSAAGNKIRCAGAANKIYANQYAAIDLEYDTSGYWYLIDT